MRIFNHSNTLRFIAILLIILLGCLLWYWIRRCSSHNNSIEGFDDKNNPVLPINPNAPPELPVASVMSNQTPIDPTSGKPVNSAVVQGGEIAGLQGAWDQFLEFHTSFCQAWTPLITASMNYETKSAQSGGAGNASAPASAVGNPTAAEYVNTLGQREGKTFVDCTVSFPDKLGVGVAFQQMPYPLKAYTDSLTWGISQAQTIVTNTQNNLANISSTNPAPVTPAKTESFENAHWHEGFLDLTSQNCKEQDGVIQCVVSIDTTNRDLYGRLSNRLAEFQGQYDALGTQVIKLNGLIKQLQQLQEQLQNGQYQ